MHKTVHQQVAVCIQIGCVLHRCSHVAGRSTLDVALAVALVAVTKKQIDAINVYIVCIV